LRIKKDISLVIIEKGISINQFDARRLIWIVK